MSSTTKLNLSFLSRLKNTVLNNSASLPDITGKNLGEFHADRKVDPVRPDFLLMQISLKEVSE
jgi:hypothetical protein